MNSRLLAQLDAAIAQTANPVEADVLRAERVGLLAREGRVDEARSALTPLQRRHQSRPDAATAAALCLADAMVDYFSDLSGQARVKLQQARALSLSANRMPLQAVCLAWMAHLDYVHTDIDGVARNASLALRLAAPDHHSARSRACLVIAMAYHYGGRIDRAQGWYAKARQHASAEGDAATISALMHNMAALRSDQARMAAVFADDAKQHDVALQALTAAESSSHFDDRMGGTALAVLRPILRAQTLVTQSRYAEALVLFEAHFGDALATGLGRLECSLRADVAWCRAKLAQPAHAREQAKAAVAALRPECDLDDVALTHGRLAKVHELLGEPEAAQRHARLAQEHWQRHVAEKAQIIAVLDATFGTATNLG
jgi:tetratricopeptide (TPR) repeat protein